MFERPLIFEKLDPIEARICQLSQDAAYLVIWELGDQQKEERLGRLNLEPGDVLPFLLPPPAHRPGDTTDDDLELEDDLSDDPDDDTDHGHNADDSDDNDDQRDDNQRGSLLAGAIRSVSSGHEPSWAELLQGACRWIREICARQMEAWPSRRFRVRVFAAKGSYGIDGGCFTVRNPNYKPLPRPAPVIDLAPVAASITAPVTAPPAPLPVPALPNKGLDIGYGALGEYYARFGEILLGGVNQMQTISNHMLAGLAEQLSDSRGQVDNLVASILNFRASQLETAQQQQGRQAQDEMRNVLARDAIHQLGDVARAFLTARGIPPELADVFGTLSGSPELVAALADPQVRELLRDPQHLQAMAHMLRQVGQQRAALLGNGGSSAGGPGAAPGGPPMAGSPGGIPGMPRIPGVPPLPGLPQMPGIPLMPGIPHSPGIPSMPGMPHTPGVPPMPGMPHTPGIPPMPGMPPAPGTPSVPGMPQSPGLSPLPGDPCPPTSPPAPAWGPAYAIPPHYASVPPGPAAAVSLHPSPAVHPGQPTQMPAAYYPPAASGAAGMPFAGGGAEGPPSLPRPGASPGGDPGGGAPGSGPGGGVPGRGPGGGVPAHSAARSGSADPH